VLDRLGHVGIAHNTPYIAHAIVTASGKVTTGIKYTRTSPPPQDGEG
jgi:hypothetical protein